jgi:hypothetical protein
VAHCAQLSLVATLLEDDGTPYDGSLEGFSFKWVALCALCLCTMCVCV